MKQLLQDKIIALDSVDKSTWNIVHFGDIAFNISERVEPHNTDAEIYVGLEHLDSDSIHIRRRGVPSDVKGTKLKVYKGDIIFGKRRAYQRKAAIADFDGICSAHAMVLRANPEGIDQDLFPLFLHSDAFMNRAVEVSEGSLSPTIKWKILSEQQFRLPPMEMQKKLAELLWAVDEMEEVILNNIKIIGDIFQLSLGEISSKNTADKRLGGLIELNYGKGLKESNRTEGKFSVVSSSGISGTHDKFLVEGPGIVVGRKGSAGEITWVENNFWPIDTAYWVSLKDIENTDLRFVYYLLESLNLSRLSISTAVPGLNRDDALESSVNIPTLENQIKIREKLDLILGKKQEMLHRFDSTRNLRQSLINSIF